MSLRQVNQNCCRGPVKGEGMSGTPKVVASAHTCCYQFGLCCHYHHCNFPHHCHFHHQYHHHWPNIYKFLPSWQSWLVNLLKFGIRNLVFDIRNSDSINFDYSIFEFRILFHYSPTPILNKWLISRMTHDKVLHWLMIGIDRLVFGLDRLVWSWQTRVWSWQTHVCVWSWHTHVWSWEACLVLTDSCLVLTDLCLVLTDSCLVWTNSFFVLIDSWLV